jgi:hypothetical protein
VSADPKAKDLTRPYLRGQDINRWSPSWAGLWMIAIKSSGDHKWPWSNDAEGAEARFAETYPSIHNRLKRFRDELTRRLDQGRHWWELRSCSYWDEFDTSKLMYQQILFHPSFAFDDSGQLGNNKTFFLPTSDLYLLGVLDSPLMWWYNWRYLPHMKEEALSPMGFLMESLPIADAGKKIRSEMETPTRRLIEIARERRSATRDVMDWVRVQHEVSDPNTKLQNPVALDSDSFVNEVQKARGMKSHLTAAGFRSFREEHTRTIEPARLLADEARQLEYRLHDLVDEAFCLSSEDVRLMWDTAPPRMPILRPHLP